MGRSDKEVLELGGSLVVLAFEHVWGLWWPLVAFDVFVFFCSPSHQVA